MNKNKKINFKPENQQEEYFYYWLEELYDNGYIDYIEPERLSFNLNDELEINYLDSKDKLKSKKLIKKRSYTPDFIFIFNDKSENIFFYKENNKSCTFPSISDKILNKIYVDTKGEYTKHYSSSITFGDRQVMMWYKHNIFVQIVKPYIREEGKKSLFEETFTPKKVIQKEKYLKDIPNRNIKKGDSKIKFKVKTLKEFINEK